LENSSLEKYFVKAVSNFLSGVVSFYGTI